MNLFSELALPETYVSIPPQTDRETERELQAMGLGQMLREYAPGRVSRRFATRNLDHRHWIPVPLGVAEPVLELTTILPVFGVEEPCTIDIDGTPTVTTVVRPDQVLVELPPDAVKDSSNATMQWRSQFIETGTGLIIRVPTADPVGRLIKDARFFLHAQNAHVNVHRAAVSADATLNLDGRHRAARPLPVLAPRRTGGDGLDFRRRRTAHPRRTPGGHHRPGRPPARAAQCLVQARPAHRRGAAGLPEQFPDRLAAPVPGGDAAHHGSPRPGSPSRRPTTPCTTPSTTSSTKPSTPCSGVPASSSQSRRHCRTNGRATQGGTQEPGDRGSTRRPGAAVLGSRARSVQPVAAGAHAFHDRTRDPRCGPTDLPRARP